MKSCYAALFVTTAITAQTTYDEVRNLTARGVAAFHRKNFGEARGFLSAALDIDSTWVPAVLHHGLAYADWLETQIRLANTRRLITLEEYQRAELELDEAEALYPEHPEIPPLREIIRQKRGEKTQLVLERLPEKKRAQYEEKMQLAQKAMANTKYAEAMHHFSQALKIVPNSLDAKMGYAEAERLLREQSASSQLVALFRQAESYEKERRFAQAIAVYDRILRLEPSNATAQTRRSALLDLMQQQLNQNERRILAREYLQSGNEAFRRADYGEAIENYRIGQALDPKLTDWEALIRKAQAARREKEDNLFADRMRELERRYQSAMVNLLLENYPAAIDDLEVVIAIAQQFQQTETQKQAEALLQRAKEAMLRQDEEFTNRDSPYYSLVQSLTTLGLASYKKGDCDATLKHFGAITEIFPKNRIANQHILACTIALNPSQKDKILRELINGIYRLKDTNAYEARRLFDLLRFIDPQNPVIAQLEKELTEKTALLKKAVQPAEYIEALYRKALLLSQTDPEAALAVLRQLLEEDPQNAKARALFARIEGRLARERWAQSDIPISAEALRFYADGIVYYNTGQINEAKAAFAQALNLAPNFERAAVALRKCESYTRGVRF
ncbi:MAG: tetratricopeptide repeat protein [Turneriella sp.]|nr:tetratricopeptide repeat protein [Turneriella sp.]